MAKTKLTMEDVSEFLKTLPYAQFKSLVEEYSAHTTNSFENEMKRLVTANLESRLEKLGVNAVCPKCESPIIVKNGKRPNGIQDYKCTMCGSKFTRFAGTILEKTRWHWDIWVKVLELTLNNYSIEKTVNVLEKDYGCMDINPKTVWLWRMKLIHALAAYPMPKLSGVVQVDETFIRESQKASRNLQNTRIFAKYVLLVFQFWFCFFQFFTFNFASFGMIVNKFVICRLHAILFSRHNAC